MYWTKETPVKDGFYWLEDLREKLETLVVEILEGNCYFTGMEEPKPAHQMIDVLWYGPLISPPRESSES